MILDKDTPGFNLSASCLWDNESDGNINFKVEFESFYVVVTMFGVFRH